MADLAQALAEVRTAALAHQFPEAAEAAERVLAQHPDCLLALRALAWAQLALANEAALATFQRCGTLDPEDALAEVGQALWLEQHGHLDRARACFVRAWELEPQDQRIRKEVVRLGGDLPDSPLAEGINLLRAGQNDDAVVALRQAAALNPADVAAPLVLALVLWRLGGRQQAYNLANMVLAQRPRCVRAVLFVVAMEAANGRLLRTRELLVRAEHVDPGFLLYGDQVRELGLEAFIDRASGGRQPSAFGR